MYLRSLGNLFPSRMTPAVLPLPSKSPFPSLSVPGLSGLALLSRFPRLSRLPRLPVVPLLSGVRPVMAVGMMVLVMVRVWCVSGVRGVGRV